MARLFSVISAAGLVFLTPSSWTGETSPSPATVPFVLDHNRMLVDAEIAGKDGTWHKARLWVDTGNPDFFLSPELARRLGLEFDAAHGLAEAGTPQGVRLGGRPVDFSGVKTKVLTAPAWVFGTMRCDANLPSTALMKYQIVFDYPRREMTLSEPGRLTPGGVEVPAAVHPETGIAQVDAVIDGEPFSFALDNGASFSFADETLLSRWSQKHPGWPHSRGAAGCANIWGWWPGEASWPLLRLPAIECGKVRLEQVGLAGLPRDFRGEGGFFAWYSRKTARPVHGLLGPNALKDLRVTLDFPAGRVFFEKSARPSPPDMDLVGVTLRPEDDGKYRVAGVALAEGKPAVEGVEVGDLLLEVGKTKVTGATMGTVVDALRGAPGDRRKLVLLRAGKRLTVKVRVVRLL